MTATACPTIVPLLFLQQYSTCHAEIEWTKKPQVKSVGIKKGLPSHAERGINGPSEVPPLTAIGALPN